MTPFFSVSLINAYCVAFFKGTDMRIYRYKNKRGKETYLFRATLTKDECEALLKVSDEWELTSLDVSKKEAVFKPKKRR